MTEPQIRELFAREASGDPGPTQADQLARRRGRARPRRRRAGVAGTSALATAAVAVLVVGAVPGARPSSHPAAAGPPAPRQFNPLITNLSFGFLPAGESVQQGGVEPAEVFNEAGISPSQSRWAADVYAQGRCHLTAHASSLSCPGMAQTSQTVQLSGSAPAVNGHRTFWNKEGQGLVWEYARGGWAMLYAPVPVSTTLQHDPQVRPVAFRVASHLRIGAATPHLVFPARFSHLGRQWRVGESHYSAEGGVLEAQQWTLLTRTSHHLPAGDDGYWTRGAYVTGNKTLSVSTCSPNDPSTRNHKEIINGFGVVIKHSTGSGVPTQELCSAHADGLAFDIQEFGSHVPIGVASMFRHHVQLLGPNPANWTENPIG